jgi:hypothetical protein
MILHISLIVGSVSVGGESRSEFFHFCQFALANSWSVRFILAIRNGSFFRMGSYYADFLLSLTFAYVDFALIVTFTTGLICGLCTKCDICYGKKLCPKSRKLRTMILRSSDLQSTKFIV